MRTHVALLRAINVGAARRLPMADLRAVVSGLGHTDVATYIQSGNVVFTSTEPDHARVATAMEAAIVEATGLSVTVVVLDREAYDRAVAANPFPEQTDPKKLHAVFRASAPGPDELSALDAAVARARAKGSRDEITVVDRVAYLNLPDGMGRSELAAQLARLPTKEITDGGGTARNWTTVRKLQAMLAED